MRSLTRNFNALSNHFGGDQDFQMALAAGAVAFVLLLFWLNHRIRD